MTHLSLSDDAVARVALEWAIRARDPDFADWDGLTCWLEADERHATRYAEISLWDDDLDDVARPGMGRGSVEAITQANWISSTAGRRRTHPRWLPLAASLVFAVGGVAAWQTLMPSPQGVDNQSIVVLTGPAQRREMALADGRDYTSSPALRCC